MNGELFLYNCLYELVSKMHFLGQPWGEPQEMSQDRQTDTERHRQTQKDTDRTIRTRSQVAQWLACWAHKPMAPGSKARFADSPPNQSLIENSRHSVVTQAYVKCKLNRNSVVTQS